MRVAPLAAGLGALCLAAAAHSQTIIIDNPDPNFSTTGAWTLANSAAGRYGPDYEFSLTTGDPGGSPTATATWNFGVPVTGYYDVYTQYPQGSNRANNAPFTINASTGPSTVLVNQQINGGSFYLLGKYHFTTATSGSVVLGNNAGLNVVIADAIRLDYSPIAPEMRAMWVSRFEWPSSNMTTAQNNIANIMNTIKTHRFNTVLFQVRGQMDVHYPSPYEPWSNTYGWTNPGWDPLQFAIDRARDNGLEFHAYINTHTIASPIPPAVTTPQHKYNLHGPSAPPGQNWLIHDTSGTPIASTDSYAWLSPGIPEASFHTRREILHVVRNYDVDGVHFDRIRCPSNIYSYDPISIARYNGDGNPDRLDFGSFMRSQILRDLRNIQGEIAYFKPHVKTSAAPFGIIRRDSTTAYQGTGTYAEFSWYQECFEWLRYNTLDFIVPQIYWTVGSAHPFEKLLSDWMARTNGRHIVAGSTTGGGSKSVANLMAEHTQTRLQNAHGHCIFSVNSMGAYWSSFSTGPYNYETTTPLMPWKVAPTTGFLIGTIVDENNNPVVDARVHMDGDSYNYLSAFDGFFAVLDVAPGTTASLRAARNGFGSAALGNISITAGQATSVTLQLQPRRGHLEFEYPRYDFDSSATITLHDADLAGDGTANITVSSTAEPGGEPLVLTEISPGLFRGNIPINASAPVSGNGSVQVSIGGTLTASYSDADDGAGSPRTATATVPIRMPPPIMVESRTVFNGAPPSTSYTEGGPGSWTTQAAVSDEYVKSLAPDLIARTGRYSTTNGAWARFRPQILVEGYYNVYVTLPGPARGGNNVSPGAGYRIVNQGADVVGTFDLSVSNGALTDNWLLLASMVPFDAGTAGYLELTNNNAASSGSQRFFMDGARFEFVQPIPVTLTGFEIE